MFIQPGSLIITSSCQFRCPKASRIWRLRSPKDLRPLTKKTAAITAWLRENIEYSTVIPTPPANQDVIEWILFSEKKAFCNYYSTAEILMLRSLGIPARWAVGYAQGEFNEDEGIYEVRAKDSHSWPEVYFPAYGWVEFEPTAGLPGIERPSGEDSSSTTSPYGGGSLDQNPPREEPDLENPKEDRIRDITAIPTTAISPAGAVGLAIGLLLVVVLIFLVQQGRRNPQKSIPVLIENAITRRGWRTPALIQRWASYVRLTPIEQTFATVEWVIRIMGAGTITGTTPAEQVATMVKVLPAGASRVERLLDEYQKAIYSLHPADLEAARQASRELIRLSLKTRLKMMVELILSGSPRLKPKIP